MGSIDWQQVIGSILIGGSGVGGVIWAAIAGWKKFRTGTPATTAERSADAPPPDGAIEWVKDIEKAMGGASPKSVLLALLAGYTRAEAQKMRIAELESVPKAKPVAVPMDLTPRAIQEDAP
jgi:hypothetical protein